MAVKIDKGFAYGNINMTPMIDCVFLLLIFFLVATKFEEAEREMNVVLPQASEAMPMTAKPKEIIVNVTGEGKYVVSREALNEGQLLSLFRQAVANNPGRPKVIIRGDRLSPWENVMTVMNVCNQAEIRDYLVSAAGDD